jgi:hypothetical protein
MYIQILSSTPIYDPIADNDNGFVTRHILRHLRTAKNTATERPALEQPINTVSLPGNVKPSISMLPMVMNNRLPLIAVYSEVLLAVSEDISIKGESHYRISKLGNI